MGVYNLFVSCFLPVLFLSSVACEEIHLDLSPLRADDGIINPPQDTDLQIGNLSSANDSKVYCKDSTFPNDVFCDLGNSERKAIKAKLVITDVFLKFSHPNGSQIHCLIGFRGSEGDPTPRLLYRSYVCYNSTDSSAEAQWMRYLEWNIKHGVVAAIDDDKIPENLKVRDITEIEVEDENPEYRALKCKRRLKNSQPSGDSTPVVTFEVDALSCISTAPYQKPPNTPVQELEVTPEP